MKLKWSALQIRQRPWTWVGISLLIVPLVAEIVTRVGYGHFVRQRSFPAIYEPDKELGYRYKPSSTGLLCIPDLCRPVEINANGYYGAPFSEKKRPGDYRIVAISHSDGTGIWTADGESFITLLRQRLHAVSDRLEVLNLSVDGKDRDLEHLALARQAVRRYGADLVLLHIHVPFVSRHQTREVYRGYVITYRADWPETRATATAAIDYLESQTVAKAVYEASYLVRALTAAYFTRSSSSLAWLLQTYMTNKYIAATPAVPESAKQSIDELLEAQRAFAAVGTRLVLLGEKGNKALKQAAIDGGLDLMTFDRPMDEDAVLPNNSHLTHKGHDAVADDLYQQLVPRLRAWGVLDGQPAATEAKAL